MTERINITEEDREEIQQAECPRAILVTIAKREAIEIKIKELVRAYRDQTLSLAEFIQLTDAALSYIWRCAERCKDYLVNREKSGEEPHVPRM